MARSRKTDLIIQIQIKRDMKGLDIKEIKKSIKGYREKSVIELIKILKKEK